MENTAKKHWWRLHRVGFIACSALSPAASLPSVPIQNQTHATRWLSNKIKAILKELPTSCHWSRWAHVATAASSKFYSDLARTFIFRSCTLIVFHHGSMYSMFGCAKAVLPSFSFKIPMTITENLRTCWGKLIQTLVTWIQELSSDFGRLRSR